MTTLTLTLIAGLLVGGSAAQAATSLPCDIYAAGGTPCAAAHSTTRALFASYNGPLYQVQRASDNSYLDIGVLAAGGAANAAPQISFCAATLCTITKIYDQTSYHNDMPISSGGYWPGPGPNGSDIGANAMALPVTVGGRQVFGVKVTPGVGYRVDNARGIPVGAQPEGIYMVTSSNYVNGGCCFDYGTAQNSHNADGRATMNAIYWGNACWFGGCVGTGPWVEADLEWGLFQNETGANKDPNNSGVHHPFVSAWLKNNGTTNFTLKHGNGNSGGLTTTYSGRLPNGYSPMKMENSVLLGTGGDNSPVGVGYFFEGAITFGFPSNATEDAVQASITAAGYAFPSTIPVNRLQSYNFSDRYVRHARFDARIDANVSPAQDAQWRIVPGLANAASEYVSFESVNHPGYFLRHFNYDFTLARYDGTARFAADATFRRVAGLADSTAVSFQSVNFPDRYVRHFNYLLRLDPVSTATARADATFRITG